MNTQRIKTQTIVGLLAALALAGCAGDSGETNANTNRTVPPFTAQNDVQYIDAIVPHHQMALHMAEREVAAGQDPELKSMAQEMIEMQEQEIQMLTAARQALTGIGAVPPPPVDQHMEADMELIMGASGSALDRLFIEHMIAHHAKAISLAHRAQPNMTRADVIQNTKDVQRDQAREIGELEAMLTAG